MSMPDRLFFQREAGLLVLPRGRLSTDQPCLHCDVCDADLLHGDFCPLPKRSPEMTVCRYCEDATMRAVEAVDQWFREAQQAVYSLRKSLRAHNN